MTFSKITTIRFKHCDPAGIVFYPRYFEMLNDLVEDWFSTMDWDFASLHSEKKQGIPTVSIETQFLAASRLGDVLEFKLELLGLGNSSFELAYSALCEGELRLKAKAKLVYISSEEKQIKSMPIPDSLREKMRSYLATEGSRVSKTI